jgi:hypothetical protein
VFFNIGCVDFFGGVLVAADDDGRFVDVEKENVIGDIFAAKEVFFDGEVHLGVVRKIIRYVEHVLWFLSIGIL